MNQNICCLLKTIHVQMNWISETGLYRTNTNNLSSIKHNKQEPFMELLVVFLHNYFYTYFNLPHYTVSSIQA